MIIGPDNAWCFVSVPKCATHTLYDVLTKHYGGMQRDGAYHQNQVPRGFLGKVYTCVRDPWSRTVGAWGRMVHPRDDDEPMEFNRFVEWLVTSPQTRPIHQPQSVWLKPVLDGYDVRAWHLETLDEDMVASGFDTHGELPVLWSAEGRGVKRQRNDAFWWGQVQPELVEWFKEWSAEDRERFGY